MKKKQVSRFKQILFNHLYRVKGKLFVAALCMFGFILAELSAPWPFKFIFDHILLDKPFSPALSFLEGPLQGGKVGFLLLCSFTIVLIGALQGVSTYLQVYFTSRIGHQMVYALRRELFAHLQRLSLSFHNRACSGELLTKVASDTKLLKDLFAGSVLQFVTHLLILISMFGILFVLNWQLSLIILATLPLLCTSLFYRFRHIKASAKKQRKEEGKLASRISEVLASVSLVQAFGREKYEDELFETESAQTLKEGIRTARMEATATRTVEIISAIGQWAVVFFGSLQVLKGRMTPGDVLIFWSYVGKIYRPIKNLVKLSSRFTKAMAGIERINELLEIEPEIQDNPNAIEAANLTGEIVFDNVSFDYGDGKEVLKDTSFTINPGQQVALIGSSGAGKSTIVCLILRLFEAQKGAVLIDGTNVNRYRRESLRSKVGVVLQDSILFGTTIMENIAYGKPDATPEEVIGAAKAANAHDFISGLENGYNTIIGEQGATLSGGQQRRIAIARALIRNASILVLDEPMAGLDVESASNIRDALTRLIAGKTCLVITHDLEVAAEADLVLVLEGGRIVERGAPTDLLAGTGQYRRLHKRKNDGHEVQSSDPGVFREEEKVPQRILSMLDEETR